MKEIKRISLNLLVCLGGVFVFSGWGDTWDEIRRTAGTIISVTSDFTQEKQMKILSRPLISRGRFYFQAPGSLRWEYTSPLESVLIIHGGSAVRYNKKDSRVIKDSGVRMESMRVVLDEITAWLKGDFNTNPDFAAQLLSGRKIVLTPRDPSLASIIKKIELQLSDVPGIIRDVRIFESSDSYTVIKFHNVTLNKKIDESVFRKI